MDKSFTKGLRLLETLAKSDRPRGVAELSRELDMTKSNVHRLLTTLVTQSFAERQAEDGTYRAGIKLWELGALVANRLDVRAVAAPFLVELKDKTGETAHLSVLDGHHMIYIDRVETDQYVRTYGRIGARAPTHCTGTGKVMLAHAPASVVAEALADLQRFTPSTITSVAAMKAELQRVRDTGVAVTKAEWRNGVWSVAAPIFGATGVVVAGIGISGPADRIRPRLAKEFKPIVIATAAQVSAKLGAQRPSPPLRDARKRAPRAA